MRPAPKDATAESPDGAACVYAAGGGWDRVDGGTGRAFQGAVEGFGGGGGGVDVGVYVEGVEGEVMSRRT